jgi:acylphosphatase
MTTDYIEIHAIAQGEVQGVGFRATVKQYATQIGLKGTVRNLNDGTVEIFVQGERNKVLNFLQRISGNVGLAHVDEVSSREVSINTIYRDFQILF